jgi:lipopolysaccharide/colanic/teichoic acid biosynthesis glycosyltransferase
MASRSTLPTFAVATRRGAWPAAQQAAPEPLDLLRVVAARAIAVLRTAFASPIGMATTLPWLAPVAPHPPLSWVEREGPRRWLNVAVAATGLLLALPLMAIIAALIKLTSRGPVLFAQQRVGVDRRALTYARGNTRRTFDHGGRLFTMWKFRTMRTDADRGRQVWARPDDERVTPIGRVLRHLRLDELPQLWNVLRGDMNLVGPRPEQPAIFAYLRERIEGYQRRQRVRPGITGWAQVNLPYDQCDDDVRRKLSFDLSYIRRQSALQDLKIMLRTPAVMLGRRGGW